MHKKVNVYAATQYSVTKARCWTKRMIIGADESQFAAKQ
jgi:hypothetical protein